MRRTIQINQASVEPAEQPIILVKCNHASGPYWPERDAARTTTKAVIEDIRSGELPNVVAVYEIGRAVPVTEDIAREVLSAELNENGEISPRLMDFLEGALGCATVAMARAECAA